MFITAVEAQTEPQTALLRTGEGETIQSPLNHAESEETLGCPRRKLANRSMNPQARSGIIKNSRTSQLDKSVGGLSFARMTLREMEKVDKRIEVCSPNVYNGNKAMRGLSLNDKRFDMINKDPKVSSQVKNTHLPQWQLNSEKKIDFRHHVYNRNIYKPKTNIVTRRTGEGYN